MYYFMSVMTTMFLTMMLVWPGEILVTFQVCRSHFNHKIEFTQGPVGTLQQSKKIGEGGQTEWKERFKVCSHERRERRVRWTWIHWRVIPQNKPTEYLTRNQLLSTHRSTGFGVKNSRALWRIDVIKLVCLVLVRARKMGTHSIVWLHQAFDFSQWEFPSMRRMTQDPFL